MKFRAQLHSKDFFLRVLSTLEKIGKTANLVLSPTLLQLFLVPSAASSIKVRIEIAMEHLFTNVVIQSLSENHIFMEIDVSNLCQAIKSCQRVDDVLLSLSKKDGFPNLSIQLKPSADIKITQDIPIHLLKREDFEQSLVSPLTDLPDVQICLPPMKPFYALIERYKSIDSSVLLLANMDGKLSVKAESTQASATTFYKDLLNPSTSDNPVPMEPDPTKIGQIKLDIRKFLKILSSYQLVPSNVVACIFNEKALVLHVLSENLYVMYEIPHIPA